jgi:hypothetical protein
MKTDEGVDVLLHAPAALAPGEIGRRTRWIGGWVDPRVCLNAVKKRKSWHAEN